MNKLEVLKFECQARISWIDDRFEQPNMHWPERYINHWLTRKKTLQSIVKRIEELEGM